MRKYKLIQWYPSLPEHFNEGMEVEGIFAGGTDYQSATKIPGGLSLPKREVEDNPRYWEFVQDGS